MSDVTPLPGARIAIANRGEIAVRIAATCRRLGATPILLLGEPDRDGYAARQVGRVEVVGEAGAELDAARVVAAAQRAGAGLLHPGYGFLSERSELAAACAAAGIRFVGPSPETLALCGDKIATLHAARAAGVPTLPASLPLGDDPAGWDRAAAQVGFPLLVKPAGAGGGRGMRRVCDAAALAAAVAAARREAAASGAGAVVYLERELTEPRHVEVQVVAEGTAVLVLGDRDCSLQRRHQKVVEEAPAPNLATDARRALHNHATALARAVGLSGVATCEFLLGADGTLAFLEINPRLQVEHPVTELVAGIDLVAWQLRVAAGDGLPAHDAPAPRGHAVEARVYAEDPAADFLPSPGTLRTVAWPVRPDVRVDAGYASGDAVPAAYDPLLAKLIAHGPDRDAALAALRDALDRTVVAGVATNVPWLLAALSHPEMATGRTTTATAARVPTPRPPRTTALAAAVAHALDRPPSDNPWAAIGPFRLAGTASLAFHGDDEAEAWEERAAVRGDGDRDHWLVRLGDDEQPLRWWRGADGVWSVALGNQVARVAVVEEGDGLEVAGAGGRWRLRAGPLPPTLGRSSGVRGDGRVRAPLPGRVLRVDVTVGDRVAAGTPLVTLSSMKIELACDAPAAGVVRAVHRRPDEQVEAGDVLVELDLDEEPEPAAAGERGGGSR